jgi:hypothetical protein
VVQELAKSVKNPIEFLRKKSRVEGGGARFPVKQLSGNYGFERRNYVEGGKQANPFSASSVAESNHNTFDNMGYDQFIQSASETGDRVYLCAEHVSQLEGVSPLSSQMEVKD